MAVPNGSPKANVEEQATAEALAADCLPESVI
jgi:hypothetical protein